MFQLSFLALTLCGGVLVEPFPIAQAEPDHHQVVVRAAMAPDGRFAVAWVDSVVNLSSPPDYAELEMFVRFFEPDGTPLTEPQRIEKVADTNRIYWPDLAMDSLGNTVLLWAETRNKWGSDGHVRFKLFDREGVPIGSPRTVTNAAIYSLQRPIGLSRNSQGEFVVTWCGGEGVPWIWVRRYAAGGSPKGDSFSVHGENDTQSLFMYPQVALNDNRYLVATWLQAGGTNRNYPKFQVFDAEDSSVLEWDNFGHRLDDGGSKNATRIEPHWLDNQRFVAFWVGGSDGWLLGRGFSDRGLTPHPVQKLVSDGYQEDSFSRAAQWGGRNGWFNTAVNPDQRWALTYTRSYVIINDTSFDAWYHQVGVLGAVEDDTPVRETGFFEYSPPYEEDTAGKDFNFDVQPPAVACNDDRLVWIYSRFNPDTIFEAFAMITDWDMGVGIAEQPIIRESPIHLETSINRLSYDLSGKAELILYSADGRRVLSETIENQGTWTPSPSSHLPSGVYFARVSTGDYSASGKVIVIH